MLRNLLSAKKTSVITDPTAATIQSSTTFTHSSLTSGRCYQAAGNIDKGIVIYDSRSNGFMYAYTPGVNTLKSSNDWSTMWSGSGATVNSLDNAFLLNTPNGAYIKTISNNFYVSFNSAGTKSFVTNPYGYQPGLLALTGTSFSPTQTGWLDSEFLIKYSSNGNIYVFANGSSTYITKTITLGSSLASIYRIGSLLFFSSYNSSQGRQFGYIKGWKTAGETISVTTLVSGSGSFPGLVMGDIKPNNTVEAHSICYFYNQVSNKYILQLS